MSAELPSVESEGSMSGDSAGQDPKLLRRLLRAKDRIRQFHRWLSMAFVLTVVANFAAMTHGRPPAWITYSPLLPLALLLLTGMYLFVLPYAARWRSRSRAV